MIQKFAAKVLSFYEVRNTRVTEYLLFIYLKTSSMKVNWKKVALYVLRIIELVITGAAGGTIAQL